MGDRKGKNQHEFQKASSPCTESPGCFRGSRGWGSAEGGRKGRQGRVRPSLPGQGLRGRAGHAAVRKRQRFGGAGLRGLLSESPGECPLFQTLETAGYVKSVLVSTLGTACPPSFWCPVPGTPPGPMAPSRPDRWPCQLPGGFCGHSATCSEALPW